VQRTHRYGAGKGRGGNAHYETGCDCGGRPWLVLGTKQRIKSLTRLCSHRFAEVRGAGQLGDAYACGHA
jgi:hypothetical protein